MLTDIQEDGRCYAEISLGNLAHNIAVVREQVRPGTRICAVVKANAYGHGALEISRCCRENGIDFFAVACLSEARELREGGIKDDLLILGPSLPETLPTLCQLEVTQTLSSLEDAEAFSEAWQARAAEESLPPLKVHIKLDTGLSRHGFSVNTPEDLAGTGQKLLAMQALPGLCLEGIFTHFATAASQEPEFLELQARRFQEALTYLKELGLHFPVVHCANSALIAGHPELNYNMVRPGIMLYGSRDGDFYLQQVGLKPVMTLKARISAIRLLHKGDRVSYGGSFIAPEDMPIAIMECGYADGLLHSLSDIAIFNFKGQAVHQIGRICMDRCMLDLRNISGLKVGDYVTIFGGQGDEYLDPEIQAERAGTISYELFSLITPRVPRIYRP